MHLLILSVLLGWRPVAQASTVRFQKRWTFDSNPFVVTYSTDEISVGSPAQTVEVSLAGNRASDISCRFPKTEVPYEWQSLFYPEASSSWRDGSDLVHLGATTVRMLFMKHCTPDMMSIRLRLRSLVISLTRIGHVLRFGFQVVGPTTVLALTVLNSLPQQLSRNPAAVPLRLTSKFADWSTADIEWADGQVNLTVFDPTVGGIKFSHWTFTDSFPSGLFKLIRVSSDLAFFAVRCEVYDSPDMDALISFRLHLPYGHSVVIPFRMLKLPAAQRSPTSHPAFCNTLVHIELPRAPKRGELVTATIGEVLLQSVQWLFFDGGKRLMVIEPNSPDVLFQYLPTFNWSKAPLFKAPLVVEANGILAIRWYPLSRLPHWMWNLTQTERPLFVTVSDATYSVRKMGGSPELLGPSSISFAGIDLYDDSIQRYTFRIVPAKYSTIEPPRTILTLVGRECLEIPSHLFLVDERLEIRIPTGPAEIGSDVCDTVIKINRNGEIVIVITQTDASVIEDASEVFNNGSDIDSLQINTHNHVRESEANKVQCAICLAAFRHGEQVVSPTCSHEFHKVCLAEWVKQKAECPTCRMGIQHTHE